MEIREKRMYVPMSTSSVMAKPYCPPQKTNGRIIVDIAMIGIRRCIFFVFTT